MSVTYHLTVGADEQHLRLDQFLVKHLPATLSRTAIQRFVEQGTVTVAGRVAKSNLRLKSGQTIVAMVDDQPPPDPDASPAENIPLDIIYEDAEVLVINKPPGLVTHPAPGNWSGTLVNAVAWHLQQAQRGALLPRAGIVHRLDKDTSGLLIVAKTDQALRILARQLKDRTISRTYLAIVEGDMRFSEGTVRVPLGRSQTRRKEMSVRRVGGKDAVTHYKVIARLPGKTVVQVKLETGRTHQIRVHLAHLGHPVLGDPVYGRRPAKFWASQGISRQLLHAAAIRFTHPSSGEPIELTAPLPEDLARWIPAGACDSV